MSTHAPVEPGWSDGIRLGPLENKISDDELFEFCQLNRHLRIERTSEGDLIIMPPAGGSSGHTNLKLVVRLGSWAEADATGLAFDSSTGFLLPNGAERSPDAAWVHKSRWDALSKEQQDRFPPLCPDFVVEIRSPSDKLPALRAKLREFVANGARLGWLIDPQAKKVYVYRPGKAAVCLNNPRSVSGEPVLPGFTLTMGEIWG